MVSLVVQRARLERRKLSNASYNGMAAMHYFFAKSYSHRDVNNLGLVRSTACQILNRRKQRKRREKLPFLPFPLFPSVEFLYTLFV